MIFHVLIHGRNFVVLHVLKLEDPSIDEAICSRIKEDMEELSIMKSGSYVVENCMRSSAGKLLLEKLANIRLREVEKIARNSYGNYVIQTAIQVLNKVMDCYINLFSVVI